MRYELMIRDAVTREYCKTITVEADDVEQIEEELTRLRSPVLEAIMRRVLRQERTKLIEELKSTDFFDSKGDDISHEEFFDQETDYLRYHL